jgi:exopolysaccharide biosynthesis polyprenyl glycosylphosphotransferase
LTVLIDAAVISLTAQLIPLLNLNDTDYGSMGRLLSFTLAVYFGAGFYIGAFDTVSFRGRRNYAVLASKALVLAYALIFFVFFMLRVSDNFSRLLTATMAFITIPGVAVARLYAFRIVNKLIEAGAPAELVIFDGVEYKDPPTIMAINAAEHGISTDLSDLNNVARIASFANHVERIVVKCSPDRRQDWAQLLKCLAVQSEICIPELGQLRPLALKGSGLDTAVLVSRHPLRWQQSLIKRLFDISVSSLALALLAPLILSVAIVIKIQSPGPALFRQQRLGFGNRNFVMFKFRSMFNDQLDHAGSKLTDRNDSRVTSVGAFIRRTSIDELPQLINVLRGEMSLVGPRPHAPAALAGDKLYWEVDERYWHRHVAKPGITGLAQVRGFRGNTFEEVDLQSRLDADLEYVSNWSLARDIEILFATLRVFSHEKAF